MKLKLLSILFLCIAVVAEAQHSSCLTSLPIKGDERSIQDIQKSVPFLQDITLKINFKNEDVVPVETNNEVCMTCASCLSKKTEVTTEPIIEKASQVVSSEEKSSNLRVSFYGTDQRASVPSTDRRAYTPPSAEQRAYAPNRKLRIYIPRSKVKIYAPKRPSSTNPEGSRIYYRTSEYHK